MKKRIVALKMAAVIGVAFALVAVLTIFGPVVEQRDRVARSALPGACSTSLWWIAQWPILLAGLLVAFATLLYLGPDVEQPKWQFLTPGSLVAASVLDRGLRALRRLHRRRSRRTTRRGARSRR